MIQVFNYSSCKKLVNKLFIVFIPVLLSFSIIGLVMLSAIGMLRADEFTWSGFSGVNRLEKLSIDSNVIQKIDEKIAEEIINNTQMKPPEVLIDIERPSSGGALDDHILRETHRVNDEYFSETLFIGDSRMLGLGLTCQNSNATFYASVGLSINQVDTKKVINVDSETAYTVLEAVENSPKEFKRIYIMFGLNELGWSYPKVFIRSFSSTIERLRETCPGAEICIMAIMPIASDKSVSIYEGSEANERIREYNTMLLGLAKDMNCWYLDSYGLFCDESGNLPASFASDGIHMRAEQNRVLMNYIACHAFAS